MAVLKIARMGHPVLARIADPVADPTDPEIHRLVDDMIETMVDAPGIGLAAPQVHVPLRLVVFFVPAERTAPGDEENAEMERLINLVDHVMLLRSQALVLLKQRGYEVEKQLKLGA